MADKKNLCAQIDIALHNRVGGMSAHESISCRTAKALPCAGDQ